MWSRIRLMALALVAVMLATACAAPSEEPATPPEASTAKPQVSTTPQAAAVQAGTVTVAVQSLGTMEWAPHLAVSENEITTGLVAETLITTDPETGELVGMLAESFELSPDGKTWTFKLRPNIPFNEGWGTLTSADVKYTWEQSIREDTEQRQRVQLRQAIGGDLANFEIVSDLEFKLHATEPIVTLPAILWWGPVIVPKRYYEEKGAEANERPIGTGPFTFVSSELGVEVVLEAVENHWRQTPAFKTLILKELPDEAARLIQVQSGAIDLASLSHTLIGEAEAAGLKVTDIPATTNAYLVLGGQFADPYPNPADGTPGDALLDADAPWIQIDNPDAGRAIRQALSLAIDRQLIIDTLMNGRAELSYGPLLQWNNIPALNDPTWSLPVYDLALAKQKLAEGGYPNGFPITVAVLETRLPADVPEAVAGMWEKLGLDVTRLVTDDNAFSPKIDARDTAGIAWIHDRGYYPDPSISLVTALPYRSDTNFTYPTITEYYQRMVAEADADKRFAIARELIEVFNEEEWAPRLFIMPMPWVSGPRISSWAPLPGLDVPSRLESITLAP